MPYSHDLEKRFIDLMTVFGVIGIGMTIYGVRIMMRIHNAITRNQVAEIKENQKKFWIYVIISWVLGLIATQLLDLPNGMSTLIIKIMIGAAIVWVACRYINTYTKIVRDLQAKNIELPNF